MLAMLPKGWLLALERSNVTYSLHHVLMDDSFHHHSQRTLHCQPYLEGFEYYLQLCFCWVQLASFERHGSHTLTSFSVEGDSSSEDVETPALLPTRVRWQDAFIKDLHRTRQWAWPLNREGERKDTSVMASENGCRRSGRILEECSLPVNQEPKATHNINPGCKFLVVFRKS